MLRKKGVVGKFVEFYGPGARAACSLADRATIANMAPEYGATIGFFPVDDETLAYLRLTGRDPTAASRWSRPTARSRGCSAPPTRPEPEFTDTLELDLGTVEPSLAGPKRPQDRVPLARAAKAVVGHDGARPSYAERAKPRRRERRRSPVRRSRRRSDVDLRARRRS